MEVLDAIRSIVYIFMAVVGGIVGGVVAWTKVKMKLKALDECYAVLAKEHEKCSGKQDTSWDTANRTLAELNIKVEVLSQKFTDFIAWYKHNGRSSPNG